MKKKLYINPLMEVFKADIEEAILITSPSGVVVEGVEDPFELGEETGDPWETGK